MKSKNKFIRELKHNQWTYIFILLPLAWLIVFCYVPMYGITLAFKDYDITGSIGTSDWVGMQHFETLFSDPNFWQAFGNTLIISFGMLLFCFPVPILLALLLNEMRQGRFKKVLQVLFTFPNFLSWIIVAGIIKNILGTDGLLNMFLALFGIEKQAFLMNPSAFRPILYLANIWKGAGWGAIIYLGSIVAIDGELYEAAIIDGASRIQRLWHITFKLIVPTIVVMLILNLGSIMNAGFDPIFNLSNPVVQSKSEIIDTYIYNITFDSSSFDFGYSTAVGLFKSVINFTLLIVSNLVVKKLGGRGIA